MIISRTPFRISFFGGGTDYPAWYRKHGGAVLATTIDKYCYITCRYLPPFFEHRHRVVWSKIENCQRISQIAHPVVREVLNYLKIDNGVEIHHDGDVPARSGIGSSSSFTVGLLNALHALKGRMSTKKELALESIHVEQELLKETVGSQDQVQASYGGFNHIIFHRNGEFEIRPMTLPPERIRELNSHLLLFYTGIKRTASGIAESYVHNIEDKKRRLLSIGSMVDEAVCLLNSEDDITPFGKLLHRAWKAKRSLSKSVSNRYVDDIYDAAVSSGAIGGKVTGAGGGGFMLFFVPPSKQKKVKERLKKLIHVPFNFEFSGSHIIFFDIEKDYSAAEKGRKNQTIRQFRELKNRDRH